MAVFLLRTNSGKLPILAIIAIRFIIFMPILFQLCSFGILGHWIVFCIYPQDGKVVIFGSLCNTPKEGYKDFEYCVK